MSFDSAKAYLATKGLEDRVLSFPVSSATVELAAKAVGCEPAHIAKSLCFLAEDSPLMILAAGDAKVDNPKYKAQFGTKTKMLTPEQAETLVGHSVGGICPFGIQDGVQVYLDVSLQRFPTIYPACGNASSAVKLSCEELSQVAQHFCGWVDVCKGWQQDS